MEGKRITRNKRNQPLNRRQMHFCHHYVRLNGNGTQAAIAAGYSKKTAYSMANKLLRKGEILDEITNQTNIALKTMKSDLDYLLVNKLRDIAEANPLNDMALEIEERDEDVRDADGSIIDTIKVKTQVLKIKDTKDFKHPQAIKKMKQNEKGVIEVEYHDPQKAIETLGKWNGTFREQLDITGKDGGPIEAEITRMTPEERKTRMTELLKKRENSEK